MFRLLGTLPALICASALFSASLCIGQTAAPPTLPAGPVVVGEKPAQDEKPAPDEKAAPEKDKPGESEAAAAAMDLAFHPDPKNLPPAPVAIPASKDLSSKVPLPVDAASTNAGVSANPPRTLPAKDASAPYTTIGKPYVIGSLDVLDIKVWNAPNLSGFFEVGPDGMISMPLLGEIRGDGLTKEELTRVIRNLLATSVFTEPPEVNVQVARVNSKKYYMFGGVNRPGEFPLLGPMTILDAFANAGGFHDFANKKHIYVLRCDKKIMFNFNEVSQGKHMEQNILLQNGDRIFVKE